MIFKKRGHENIRMGQYIVRITLKVKFDLPPVMQQLHEQLGEGLQPYSCSGHSGSQVEIILLMGHLPGQARRPYVSFDMHISFMLQTIKKWQLSTENTKKRPRNYRMISSNTRCLLAKRLKGDYESKIINQKRAKLYSHHLTHGFLSSRFEL